MDVKRAKSVRVKKGIEREVKENEKEREKDRDRERERERRIRQSFASGF